MLGRLSTYTSLGCRKQTVLDIKAKHSRKLVRSRAAPESAPEPAGKPPHSLSARSPDGLFPAIDADFMQQAAQAQPRLVPAPPDEEAASSDYESGEEAEAFAAALEEARAGREAASETNAPRQVALRGEAAGMGAMPPDLAMATSAGWAWALVILGALKLGRQSAQNLALEYGHLEREMVLGWKADRKLWQRKQERDRRLAHERAMEATRRMESARLRQIEQEKVTAERSKVEAARAAAEERKVKAERERYAAKEAELKADLDRRVETERKVIEERRAQARAEAEARRREAEEQKARLAAELKAKEQAELEERERIRKEKEAARQRLKSLEQTFALRLEPTIAISRPPKGTMTEDRVPKEAGVQLQATTGSAMGGTGQPCMRAFTDVKAAMDGLLSLAGASAAAATADYASQARVQAMTGQGPLEVMDDAEMSHWMRFAACRAAAAAEAAGAPTVAGFKARPREAEASCQVRTEWGVLPETEEQRRSHVLNKAIAEIESGEEDWSISPPLADMQSEDATAIVQGMPSGARVPAHVAEALTLAHLLDKMWAQRPSKQMEASPWYQRASHLVRSELAHLTSGAPKDSLQLTAQLLLSVVGPDHHVVKVMEDLAEANLSAATRSAREQRRRLQEAEIAARLLEEEWPAEAEITAARIKEREAAVPVPERVWSLRNVAGTLSLGGPAERRRARHFLEQAVRLKEAWLENPEHPGTLPELDALRVVLEKEPEWAADASSIAERQLKTCSNVASRFIRTGDAASGVILLEAAVRQFEETLGLRHPGITALSRRAEDLLSTLDATERQQISQKRQQLGLLQSVISAFAEEPEVYKTAGARTKAEQWDEGGIAPLLPLH
ncbi:hypothetical protein WJX74_001700 [Apatococcus lobatus]|uniref:Uncharacterized protein n=1 Tax=Apatococcus lobatus TaxID=904363 RepID=A0AAW1S667_9CHLO